MVKVEIDGVEYIPIGEAKEVTTVKKKTYQILPPHTDSIGGNGC